MKKKPILMNRFLEKEQVKTNKKEQSKSKKIKPLPILPGQKRIIGIIGLSGKGKTLLIDLTATYLSQNNIQVGVLDFTKNRGLYQTYCWLQDEIEEEIKECMSNLILDHSTSPVKVNDNYFLYTSRDLPEGNLHKVINIAKTENDILLLDCDKDTDKEIFRFCDQVCFVHDINMRDIYEFKLLFNDLLEYTMLKNIKIVINKNFKDGLKDKIITELLNYKIKGLENDEKMCINYKNEIFRIDYDEHLYLTDNVSVQFYKRKLEYNPLIVRQLQELVSNLLS